MNEAEKRNKELIEEIEKLKRKIRTLKSRKKYGLVWEEEKEPEQVVLDCQYKIPILREVDVKKIITDKKKPTNILIEGDNYHALSVLNYTHKGKIDVIYIDPPYNTGNGDSFRYNDKIVDKEDAYRHSKWLSFMSKRLKLARNLLSPQGLLFISIDDNEYAQLKLLCDEIFGEKNFIGPFIWKSKIGGGNDNKWLVNEHEYILTYAKSKAFLPSLVEPPSDDYKNTFKLKDKYFKERGGYYLDSLYKSGIDSNRPNLRYPIKAPDGSDIWPPTIWRLSKKEFQKRLENDEIVFKKDKEGNWKVYTKTYYLINGKPRGKRPRSIIGTFGGTRAGNQEIKDLFGTLVFKYPKNVNLIKYFISLSPKGKRAIIIDFFAGSGTTGHAVLELNKEDDGNRRFILVTNNENNIASDICYPRLKKAIKGYKNLKGKKVKGLGGNLRYFKTELLDIDHISHVSDEQKLKLTYRAGGMIALKEDTFEEVERSEWWQIFKNGVKYAAIYFKEDKSRLNELVNKLGKINKKVVLYIFSWGKNEYKNEFSEYKNIEVNDIPEPIIDVYKEVNRL